MPVQPSPSSRRRFLPRRRFLQSLAAGAAGVAVAGVSSGCTRTEDTAADEAPAPDRYAGLGSPDALGPVSQEVQIADTEIFTEGPAVDRNGQVYFTNIPTSKILKWDPSTRTLEVFRENTNQANGLRFDLQGRLLICESTTRRLTRLDLATGELTVLADAFEGAPLEAPNDIDFDSRGRLYFSARPGGGVPSGGGPNAVYRLDPDGTLTQLLREPDVQMPNGLVIAPDDATLYLVEAHADEGHFRHIKAFDLNPDDGTLSNPRIVYDFYPGRSGDGMSIDAEGNLYVAAGLHQTRGTSETLDTKPGIHLISPDGRLIAFRQTPDDIVTNCTFGGPDLQTLYITSGAKLLSLRTAIPGKSSYRPNA